jgi:hypothetical protein
MEMNMMREDCTYKFQSTCITLRFIFNSPPPTNPVQNILETLVWIVYSYIQTNLTYVRTDLSQYKTTDWVCLVKWVVTEVNWLLNLSRLCCLSMYFPSSKHPLVLSRLLNLFWFTSFGGDVKTLGKPLGLTGKLYVCVRSMEVWG